MYNTLNASWEGFYDFCNYDCNKSIVVLFYLMCKIQNKNDTKIQFQNTKKEIKKEEKYSNVFALSTS